MRSIEAVAFTSLESLVGTLEHRPQWQSHQKFQQILDCWPQVVGDVVAVQTRPLSIQRQVLSVSTATPGWSQNLAFQRHHILKKLTEYVPDHQLKDIRFSPAKWVELRKSANGSPSKKRSLKRYHFEQSEARSLWSYHPCKMPPSSESRQPLAKAKKNQSADINTAPRPNTSAVIKKKGKTGHSSGEALQTFHNWAATIQERSQQLPKCPRCKSPTPIGELQRWSICSLCAAQDW